MHKRDLVAVGTWIGIGLVLWIIAWIIASAIPVFSNLLSLIVRPPPSATLIILTSSDCIVRKLVHLRPERDLLAAHEQGLVLLLPKKDCPDTSQCHHRRYWCYPGTSSPILNHQYKLIT